MFPGWVTLAALAASFLLACGSARAELVALGHQRSSGSEVLAVLDSDTAAIQALTPTLIADCCTVPGAVLAHDAAGDRVFAVRVDFDGAATLSVRRVAAPGVLSEVALEAGLRVHALAWDAAAGRLLAVVSDAAGASVARLDPDTGARVVLAGPLAGCCEFSNAVATYLPGPDALVFAGRTAADGDGRWQLFRASLAAGDISGAMLEQAPGLLVAAPDGGLRAVVAERATPFGDTRLRVADVSADGTVAAYGSGITGCCAVVPGASVVQGDMLYGVGLRLDTGVAALYRLSLVDGTGALAADIDGDFIVQALLDTTGAGGGPIPVDRIFRDGFEALAVGKSGRMGTVAANRAGAAEGTIVGATLADGPAAGDAAARAAADSRSKGVVPPAAAVHSIPSSGTLPLMALALVLAWLARRRLGTRSPGS